MEADHGAHSENVPPGGPVIEDVSRTLRRIEALANPEVLARAVAASRQVLQRDPEDERARWALGETLRLMGELSGALDCYRRILRANPGHRRAGRLAAILGGNGAFPSGNDGEGVRPAPFVLSTRFLSDREQDDVWSVATEARFTPAGVVSSSGGKRIAAAIRSSRVLQTGPGFRELRSWFRERVLAALEGAWERLQMEPFSIGRTEVQLTSHRAGDFFGLHHDAGGSGATGERRVTFVYYFHKRPKRFSGGDLLLFDTDPARDACGAKYTRIAPLHNSILFFPSNCYHVVLPVACEGSDFQDGRFTLNGWMHPADRGTDAPQACQEAGARRSPRAEVAGSADCGGRVAEEGLGFAQIAEARHDRAVRGGQPL